MKRTPLRRKKGLRRKRSPNDFPETTRMRARLRSRDVCEARSKVCTERAVLFHHRKRRNHKDQSPENCMHLCTPCHNYIHSEMGEAAYLMGWLVRPWDDPGEIPVKRGGGA